MIKFFRHIRQSLIMENKTGKYLKYALGEIVLVVIGILIALQINNWNEQRKQDIKASGLFAELYDECAQFGVHMEGSYKANEGYITFLENIIEHWELLDLETVLTFERNDYAIQNLPLLFYISSYSQFNDPRTDIFQKAINDGSITLIENDFTTRVSASYNVINRLNEIIQQEYQLGKEINLHISKRYGKELTSFRRTRGPDIDRETLDRLFKLFRTDGGLKYLINARLDLAKVRGDLLLFQKQIVTAIVDDYKVQRHD